MVLCDEEDQLGTDARTLRTGSYSAWLKKVKNENAKARWLSNSTNRYFTIDFDAQIFYYSHSAGQRKISNPIRFDEIHGAERLPPPAKAARKGKAGQHGGFLVRTTERVYELHTCSNADAAQWVYALNAARDLGLGAKARQEPPSAAQAPCEGGLAAPTAAPQCGFMPQAAAVRQGLPQPEVNFAPTAAAAQQGGWFAAESGPPSVATSQLDTTVGSIRSQGGGAGDSDRSFCTDLQQAWRGLPTPPANSPSPPQIASPVAAPPVATTADAFASLDALEQSLPPAPIQEDDAAWAVSAKMASHPALRPAAAKRPAEPVAAGAAALPPPAGQQPPPRPLSPAAALAPAPAAPAPAAAAVPAPAPLPAPAPAPAAPVPAVAQVRSAPPPVSATPPPPPQQPAERPPAAPEQLVQSAPAPPPQSAALAPPAGAPAPGAPAPPAKGEAPVPSAVCSAPAPLPHGPALEPPAGAVAPPPPARSVPAPPPVAACTEKGLSHRACEAESAPAPQAPAVAGAAEPSRQRKPLPGPPAQLPGPPSAPGAPSAPACAPGPPVAPCAPSPPGAPSAPSPPIAPCAPSPPPAPSAPSLPAAAPSAPRPPAVQGTPAPPNAPGLPGPPGALPGPPSAAPGPGAIPGPPRGLPGPPAPAPGKPAALPAKPAKLPGPLEEKPPASGKAQLEADLGFSPRGAAAEAEAASVAPAGDPEASGWDSEKEEEGKPDKKAPEVPSTGHAQDAEASGWDSDKEEADKPGKTVRVPEGPAQVEGAAPSGWDDEKQEEKPEEKPVKKPLGKLCALVQCEDCGRSFNSESIEKHRRVCKKVFQQKHQQFNSAAKRLGEFVSAGEMVETGDRVEKAPDKVPEGPVCGNHESAAPSGFDSDEEGAKLPVPARPKTSEGGPKGGMAMEFDMCDGPRKAVPKALAARLSKKRSKKITCQDKGGSPKKSQSEPIASGWDSDDDKKKAPDTDACGAPKQRAETKAFVAARPSAAAASKDAAGAQGELGDLLAEVLTADTAVPFKGSASHSFVPNFLCTGCDHEIQRIDRHVWKDGVAYMFLRNNYPNVMKLRPQLKGQEGASAYCCQCSSRSADSSASLEDVAEGLRWKVIQA